METIQASLKEIKSLLIRAIEGIQILMLMSLMLQYRS